MINLEESEGPVINGVAPNFDSKQIFNNHYEGLELPLNFSGGVLLVTEPLGVYYFRVWDFSVVLELVFENGDLLEAFDRSSEVGQLRKMIEASFTRQYFL